MKGKIISINIRYVVYIVSFVLAVVAIYFLLPKEDNFDRYFEIGKPWTYEMVIAPKDFAIYKSEEQLERERVEALKGLEPYVARIADHRLQITGVKDSRISDWLVDRLSEVYEVGVISLQDKQELERLGVGKVIVLEGNNVKGKEFLSSVFTPKTAYDYILDKASVEVWIDDNLLKASNIVEYIEPNVSIDRMKTDQAIQIIVDGVMLTSGMVQRGEKIIDKGEVVTEESFQILKSLQRVIDGDELNQGEDVWKVVGNVVLIVVLMVLFFGRLMASSSVESCFASVRPILYCLLYLDRKPVLPSTVHLQRNSDEY